MKELVLAAVQMESSFGDIRENAMRICDWMSEAVHEGAKLVFAAYGPDGVCCASSENSEEGMLLVRAGGALPRDTSNTEMRGMSYFERRRPELYSI